MNRAWPDEQKRYNFDLTSTDSNFTYDEKHGRKHRAFALRASRTATGPRSRDLSSTRRSANRRCTGTLVDWASPQYNLDIQSTRRPDAGVGHIYGTGPRSSASVILKARSRARARATRSRARLTRSLCVRAAFISKRSTLPRLSRGRTRTTRRTGPPSPRCLTFEDFRVDFLKLAGNVRGTGTDFRWLGDLQAAAARSNKLSLGGLFLCTMRRRNYRTEQLLAEAASGRAQKFSIGDIEFADLTARNLKFSPVGDVVNFAAPNATGQVFHDKGLTICRTCRAGTCASEIAAKRTDVDIDRLDVPTRCRDERHEG